MATLDFQDEIVVIISREHGLGKYILVRNTLSIYIDIYPSGRPECAPRDKDMLPWFICLSLSETTGRSAFDAFAFYRV